MKKVLRYFFLLVGWLALAFAGSTLDPECGLAGQAAFSFGMAALFGACLRIVKGLSGSEKFYARRRA